MTNYTMTVIPEPKDGTATVLKWSGPKEEARMFRGEGNDNYICGTCGNIICEKVNRGQIRNLVLQCPKCSSYNVIVGA